MNSASLAFATLAPTLGAAASQTMQLLKSGGTAFAEMLNGESAVAAGGENPTTLSDAIRSLGNEMQQRLHESGLTGVYELLFRMDENGQVDVDVSGDGANGVRAFLQSEPNWLENLRKIASSAQLQLLQRGYPQAPEVTIGMSQTESWMKV